MPKLSGNSKRFLQAYPNSTEGYTRRASYYMNIGDDEHNALAEADLKKAMDVSGNKTEGQYNVAKIIYSYCINLEEGKKHTETGVTTKH